MLLEEFDNNKDAIINPTIRNKKMKVMPKTCVSFFSKSIMKEIVETLKPEIIATISNATAYFPVYKIKALDRDIAVFQSAMGASACVSNLEELFALGVENLLLVGCCGCLEKDIEEYSIILPTSALRDEGTSYHYAPPSDETVLQTKPIGVIEKVLKKHKISYRKGKTWTTDAIFRETKNKLEKRKKQGAIVVDMECSAVNALCQFRGKNFAQIFYGADNLGGEEYDPRSLLANVETFDVKKKIIPLAFECAVELDKKL